MSLAGHLTTLPELLALRAAEDPAAPAMVGPYGATALPVALSWEAFAEGVAGVAHGLHGQLAACELDRVEPDTDGPVLALMARNSVAWETLHQAALGLGMTVVGLDAHDLPERRARVLALTGARVLAVDDASVLAELTAAARAQLKLVITLADDGGVNEAQGDGTQGDGTRGSEAQGNTPQGNETGADAPRVIPLVALDDRTGDAPAPLVPLSADTRATIIFTSGSTGDPKGVAYSHGQLLGAVDAILDAFPAIGPGDRLACWLPLSNLFQRMLNLAAIGAGASSHFVTDPRTVAEALPAIAPRVLIGVPRFYEKLHAGILAQLETVPAWQRPLVRLARRSGAQAFAAQLAGRPLGPLAGLRYRLLDRLVLAKIRGALGGACDALVSGSAPLPKAIAEDLAAFGLPVYEAYGLSENVVPVAMNRPGALRPGSVGKPLGDNEVRLAADGEVLVRGRGVYSGYLGAGERREVDAEGFLATGDLGRIDDDGFLWLTGRKSEIFKTSTGRKLAPAPTEAALRALPFVEDAILVGQGRKLPLALLAGTEVAGRLPATAAAQREAIGEVLRAVPDAARPAACALLPKPFSIAAGELTANLKLRRGAIESAHAAELAALEALLAAAATGGPSEGEQNGLALLVLS